MARTVANAVENILGDHYNSDGNPSLGPFIEAATDVVTRVSTCATTRGVTLSSTTLELVERWLAAHFYLLSDPVAQEKVTGDAEVVFQGETGKGLEATHYGKNAMVIDHSGCLASMSQGRVASVMWLGKAPSDQIDYVDRD